MNRRELVLIAQSPRVRFAGWTAAAILAVAPATAYGVALWKARGWVHATRAQGRYNARVLVISVGGAVVVGAGLLYTARNYRLSRRGQVTDRLTVALERLGSTELYVRIGGVHALDHVMRDSPGHHDDVIEVLTEFIRGGVPHRASEPDRQAWMHPVTGSIPDLPPERPTPDVQAALTALAQRPFRPERQRINLALFHLTNALLIGADLTHASLDGANLAHGQLQGAHLAYASFMEADLTCAWLIGADLTRASLLAANLAHGHLMGANLSWADLYRANLTDASFIDANLTHGRLDGVNLRGANLELANLIDASLVGAKLTDANLVDADLTGAHLDGAILTGAWLKGANLTRATFEGADLTGATLGKDPQAVPPGWIVTDPETGQLGRATAQDT